MSSVSKRLGFLHSHYNITTYTKVCIGLAKRATYTNLCIGLAHITKPPAYNRSGEYISGLV